MHSRHGNEYHAFPTRKWSSCIPNTEMSTMHSQHGKELSCIPNTEMIIMHSQHGNDYQAFQIRKKTHQRVGLHTDSWKGFFHAFPIWKWLSCSPNTEMTQQRVGLQSTDSHKGFFHALPIWKWPSRESRLGIGFYHVFPTRKWFSCTPKTEMIIIMHFQYGNDPSESRTSYRLL
jgi:hypothetical protein